MVDNTTRFQWTKLSWEEAQRRVVELLHSHGYMTFHEKRLSSGRADGVVIRKTKNCIYIGVVEVKHYKHVTLQTQKKAVIQAMKYLNELHQETSSRYHRREVEYFIVTVYTHDYPTTGLNTSLTSYRQYLPEEILHRGNLKIFSTSPEFLIHKLIKYGLVEPQQKNLNDFFE